MFFLLLSILLSLPLYSDGHETAQPTDVCQDKDADMTVFIDSLMSEMTVEEKVGQLTLVTWDRSLVTGSEQSHGVAEKISAGAVGGVFNVNSLEERRKIQELAVRKSRLGIPVLFGLDVIHGFRTTMPIPFALSCTWDMDLIERTARAAADEASSEGIDWVYSPMVDISRDPRWGRVAEGAGEDPCLGSKVAAAMVSGHQQGNLSSSHSVMSCVKHFAMYGACEGGRDYDLADMSTERMYNEYLPPYKAAVDAGAGSVMTSFNSLNGVPSTANEWLLTDLLRDEWKFDGFTVSDYTSVGELTAHGLGNLAEVSSHALKAGLDMDMVSEGVMKNLGSCLGKGLLTEADIDKACRRILEAKYKLGLFKNPFLRLSGVPVPRGKYDELALEAAHKSMVLLKNSDDVLPLGKNSKVCIVGPVADSRAAMMGTWAGPGIMDEVVTIKEGIRRYVPDVRCVTGCLLTENRNLARMAEYDIDRFPDNEVLIAEALAAAEKSDVIVAVLGENSKMSGESASMTDISLQEPQKELLDALYSTGKKVVLVLISGRPMTIEEENSNCDAIVAVWAPGAQGGNAVADVLFGEYNPCGRLSMTFPRNVGQIPLYYSMKSTGRPYVPFRKYRTGYIDCESTPLYPFGYGLSYSRVDYSDMTAEYDSESGTVKASVKIRNASDRDVIETVQLYVRDEAASVTRPIKELKTFSRENLGPGESRVVCFDLPVNDLGFWTRELEYVVEPGTFVVEIGPDSQRTLTATIEYPGETVL